MAYAKIVSFNISIPFIHFGCDDELFWRNNDFEAAREYIKASQRSKKKFLQYKNYHRRIMKLLDKFVLQSGNVSENNLIVIIFDYLYSDDNMFVDGFAPYDSVSINGWYAPVMFKQKMKFFWKQILFGDMFDHLLIK